MSAQVMLTKMKEKKKMDGNEIILETLRIKGFRITKQRRIIIDIILRKDCSCCKDIYYEANKIDPGIGAATVYRMIKTLEDIGAINRKNQYKLLMNAVKAEKNEFCGYEGCIITLKNKKKIRLNPMEFNQVLKAGLDIMGFAESEDIDSLALCILNKD